MVGITKEIILLFHLTGGVVSCVKNIYHFCFKFTWPEIADNATAHARGYMAIWPLYALRKRMAEVKENENRTTSGLPGTSAVIRSSS